MKNILKKANVFIKRNSPTIISIIGSAGVILTAITTAKATVKAIDIIDEKTDSFANSQKLTNKEIILCAGKEYIVPIIISSATIFCMFKSNSINKNRIAALMALYSTTSGKFQDYKEKVKSIIGESAEKKVTDLVDCDRSKVSKVNESKGNLYLETYSGLVFRAKPEDILLAEYDTNRIFATDGYVTLNTFLLALGIETIAGGEDIGWSFDDLIDGGAEPWIDFTEQDLDEELQTESLKGCKRIGYIYPPTFLWEKADWHA